jgi:pyridoxal phosphate enzyme (YggS family)
VSDLRANGERVRERIAAAAARAGRNPGEIRLMAVTKTVSPERVAEALAAGLDLFGENRVQEAAEKIPAVAAAAPVPGARPVWHLIGHLQSNKAAAAARLFDAVQTVDREELARRLDAAAAAAGRTLEVLVQVKTSDEQSKSGVAPAELRPLVEAIAARPSLRLTGLMTIPAPVDDPEDARPAFARLRELAREAAGWALPGVTMTELSMGMSQDYEAAILEGATLVRIGRALFGERR